MVFVTSKFDDVLLEHGGLPHVFPLAVHRFLKGGHIESLLLFGFYYYRSPSCLKFIGWGVQVAA